MPMTAAMIVAVTTIENRVPSVGRARASAMAQATQAVA